MKEGFIITELHLKGNVLKPAAISFKKGLNVISGPTNTGKSYIFQCINYMLGASKSPKNIKEARGYQQIFLEICNFNNEYYTLESDLRGGNFKLYESKFENINESTKFEVLNRKHDPNNINTISAFLLSQCNMWGKKIRTNAKGKTRCISYRDIIHFIMVSEERIITQESPIVSHYTKATEELNTLKFLLTGIDDATIIESIKVNEIHNRKGKIELLSELISTVEKQLSDKDSLDQIGESILKVSKGIDQLNLEYQKLYGQFSLLEEEKKENAIQFQLENSKYKVLKGLLNRSNLLKEQYDSDISRLRATIEASTLLSGNHTLSNNCPLCNNVLNNKCDEEEIAQIINSCENEIVKIESLKKELISSVNMMTSEVEQLSFKINLIEIKIARVSGQLEIGIGKQIENILNNINSLNQRKSQLMEIMSIHNQYKDYKVQKEKLESSILEARTNSKFDMVTTATITELSNKIKTVLEGCNFPDITGVSYSEEKEDFVISGEDRSLSGKGYRAITYSAYIVGLQKLIASKNFNIGIPILDSPFVTYKKPKAGNEGIPVDLAMDFYRYLADCNEINQFIIIENEEPPLDIIDRIEHIVFSGIVDKGRFGFIPIN